MALSFYITLLALTTECIIHVSAETLQLDGAAEKDTADKLSKEHADYAAMEAILGKDPSKKDACNKEKDEYADAVQEYLKSKGKDAGSIQYIQISTDPSHLLPVITKGTPCEASTDNDDALYWFNKDVVNNIMEQAKAAHQDPHKALEDFTKSAQFKTVADNLKYIQERDDVKDIISKGQNLHQAANEWLNSLNFNIPGLVTAPKAAADSEKKAG